MIENKPTYEELERRCRRAETRLEKIAPCAGADLYQTLFDNSHAIMLVIDPDSGQICDANQAAADYYAWTRSELTGMNISDLNLLSKQEVFAEMQAAREERRQFFRFRHRRAYGDIRDVEVHSGPVVMGGRQLLHSIIHDVTSYRQTEDALRFSAAWYRIIFEKSPLGLIRFSPDGTILDCNDQFIRLMGASRKDLIGFNTAQQSTPEMRRTIRKALAGETAVFEDEYTSVTGGKTLWLRVVFNPVHPGRHPTEVIATLEDVGERKQAESALKDSERRLREAQRIGRIASYERNLDTGEGYWSDEHYRLLGYEPDEAAHSFDFFLSHIHEEDRERAENILRSAAEKLERFAYDCRYVRRDGEVRHAHHTGRGVLADNGKSRWLQGTFQDITDRKRTENALQKNEERYRTLLESVSDSVFVLDRDWNQLIVNEAGAQFIGIPAEKMLNDNLLKLFPHVEQTAFFKTFERVMRERESEVIENEFHFSDGRKGCYQISVYPVPEGILCISKDVTERKRAEEALAKSEAKYKDIFNNSLWGIFQSTPEGQFLSCNAAFAKMFGYDSPEDLIASITDISRQYYVNPADRDRYMQLLHENGIVENYEFKARRKNGAEIWITNSTRVVADEEGRLLYYEGAESDITYRKQVESRLKESEEQYRRLTENAQDIIWRTDKAGKLVFINRAVQPLLGYSPEEVLGLALSDYMTKNTIERLFEKTNDVRLGKNLEKHFRLEIEYIAKNGETVPFEINVVALKNAEGKIEGYEGVSRDITERKQAEEALIKSEARLKHLLTSSPAVIFTCKCSGDMGATFISDNVTNMMGYLPEDFCRESNFWLDHVHPDDAPRILEGIGPLFKIGHHLHEYRFLDKNGNYRWVHDQLQLVYNEGGEPLEIVGSWFDISDRKDMEEQLRHAKEAAEAASRAKSEFIANMSHELRTPLNAILGYAQILLRDETLSQTQRQNIAVMRTSGEHLLTLINDILDIAKIEAGKIQLETGPTDLKAMLSRIIAMLTVKASQKNINLLEDIDPNCPRFVEADEKRLRQVLLNLLSNAIKFTDSGSVALGVGPVGDHIAFSVSDTGIGIPEDKLTAIFEPFKQLNPITRKTTGTGLGLTISRNLVRLMGGEIRVESAPGRGSEFRFKLPLLEVNGISAVNAPEPLDPAVNSTDAGAATSLPIPAPPAADVAALYAMSRIGDLSAIVDYAAKMRESDPQTEAFRRTLEQYAAECDVTAIRKLIERFMGGEK